MILAKISYYTAQCVESLCIGQMDFLVSACPKVPERSSGEFIPNHLAAIVSVTVSIVLVNAKVLHLIAENTTGYAESVCSL